MRRKSYKYIFVLNVVLISTVIIVCTAVLDRKNEDNHIRTSLTTPLIYADSLSADFCADAKGAVIIDALSGAILFEKNAHKRYPMASTTKIMTALAVIENADPDKTVEVSPGAVGIEGSSIYLLANETFTIRDLLYGLMLESGNDAAEALAIAVFGSSEKCVEYMNKRCSDLGLIDTHFDNVHGLDSENHYTTAYELAYITKTAMKNELFREIVSTKSHVTSGQTPRYFSNHNRLLNMYPCTIGVKTGYTSKSGRCLVSAAKKDNEEYIAVTLDDPLDWKDHKNMLDFAFENFKSYEIAPKDGFTIRVGFLDYAPTEDIYITTTDEADFSVSYKITVTKESGIVEYSANSMSLGSFGVERIKALE